MKIRKFLLENDKGQQFNMHNFKEGCLFTNPNGLGYSHKSEFEKLGNAFIEDNRVIEQKNPSGIANFISYDKFKEFVDFIESSNKLKFIYIVPYDTGEKTYYRDVSIKSLQKTEKEVKRLACPVEFNGLSLWYEQTTAIFTIEPKTNELRWDYKWDSKFVDYDTRSLEYINKGHVEAPIIVEINGHVINPYIELYVEGQLYQTIRFETEIQEYEKLLYGTKENEFYIQKQNTDGTKESLFSLDVIDFSNDNVIRMPKNKSCELRLKADNEILNAQVIILSYYKAV